MKKPRQSSYPMPAEEREELARESRSSDASERHSDEDSQRIEHLLYAGNPKSSSPDPFLV
jgi:hypothetical protein